MNLNHDSNFFVRTYDHAKFGLCPLKSLKDINHKPNIIEKVGNGILWTVGSLPRVIKWMGKQFHDPRVVTVALAVGALALTTLAFYPATTIAAIATVFSSIKFLASLIPLWSLKFSAYLLICSTVSGYALRASGRFSNEASMKTFYGLENYQGNPAHLSINEIRQEHKRLKDSKKDNITLPGKIVLPPSAPAAGLNCDSEN